MNEISISDSGIDWSSLTVDLVSSLMMPNTTEPSKYCTYNTMVKNLYTEERQAQLRLCRWILEYCQIVEDLSEITDEVEEWSEELREARRRWENERDANAGGNSEQNSVDDDAA